MTQSSADYLPPEHEHAYRFVRTVEDWWDGDEEDIYECEVEGCDARKTRYVSR